MEKKNHCTEKLRGVCVCVLYEAGKKSAVALLCMCLDDLSCVRVALKFVLQKSTHVIDFAVKPHRQHNTNSCTSTQANMDILCSLSYCDFLVY